MKIPIWPELAQHLHDHIPHTTIIPTLENTTINIYKTKKRTQQTKPYAKLTIYPTHILATSWNTLPHRLNVQLNHPESLTELAAWLTNLGIPYDLENPTPPKPQT